MVSLRENQWLDENLKPILKTLNNIMRYIRKQWIGHIKDNTFLNQMMRVPTMHLIQGLMVMTIMIFLSASSRAGGGRRFWNLRSYITVNTLKDRETWIHFYIFYRNH